MLERVSRYLRDVRTEFSRVSWPSRQETAVLTVLVIAMVVVLTVVIFAYDLVFQQLIQFLIGTVR